MQFTPPGKESQADAIGPVEHLPAEVRQLLDPAGFAPMDVPGPADWLSVHPEPGQTSRAFLRLHPNFPDEERRTIYLQPLEEFPPDWPSLSRLKAFTEAFFSMPIRVLPVVRHLGTITGRVNIASGKLQLLTSDIRKQLKARLPRDAYCLLGITLRDLYPGPAWNYVFGEASIKDRVGVYSFARYDPRFFGVDSADRAHLIFRRSCKVLAHETGHMFGIAHCVFFRCVMNGVDHLAELDSRPLHFCPVDLRKFYDSTQFDPVARYAHLRDFFREAGFADEAAWIDRQLARVADGARRK